MRVLSSIPILLIVLLIALLSAAKVSAQSTTGEFVRVFELGEGAQLLVLAGEGDVHISGVPGSQARVVGRLEFSERGWLGGFIGRRSGARSEEVQAILREFEADPPVSLARAELTVGRDDSRSQRDYSVSYEIEVPAAASVRSSSGSGAQIVSGISGRVDATTGSGSILLSGLSGDVTASAGSGAIRMTDSQSASLQIETGSGVAHIDRVAGELNARTGSGAITVAGRPLGSWDIEAGSGTITLQLPGDSRFSLEAHTGSGRVLLNHPLESGSASDGDAESVIGEVRGGGPKLTLRTGSGDIRVR